MCFTQSFGRIPYFNSAKNMPEYGFSLTVYSWPYHVETSPLICIVNHWTGSYMVGTVKKRIREKSYSGIFNTFCPTRNVFSRNRCRAKLKGLTENCFFAYFFRSFPIESYTQTASPVFVGQFQLSGGESNNIFLYNCCLMYLAESRVKFM